MDWDLCLGMTYPTTIEVTSTPDSVIWAVRIVPQRTAGRLSEGRIGALLRAWATRWAAM